jgi:hypothetical protein
MDQINGLDSFSAVERLGSINDHDSIHRFVKWSLIDGQDHLRLEIHGLDSPGF